MLMRESKNNAEIYRSKEVKTSLLLRKGLSSNGTLERIPILLPRRWHLLLMPWVNSSGELKMLTIILIPKWDWVGWGEAGTADWGWVGDLNVGRTDKRRVTAADQKVSPLVHFAYFLIYLLTWWPISTSCNPILL